MVKKDKHIQSNIFKCVIFKDQFRCRCVLVYKLCQCVYLFADVRTLISTHQALMCFPIYKIRNNSNDNNLYTYIYTYIFLLSTQHRLVLHICTKHVSHSKVFIFWLVFDSQEEQQKKNREIILL